MEFKGSNLIKLLLLTQCLTVLCASNNFDFFYFVQQWPGAYCDTEKECCYPSSGKPVANFGIHGLWPNRNDGTYPSNCDPNSPFNASEVSDLIPKLQSDWPSLACPRIEGINFWTHEWEKHGTCSESSLKQHQYFATALNLKQKTNLLKALTTAGIKPDGNSYSLSDIKGAIKSGVGFTPYIECNEDTSRNSQLYQVYLCVDTSGANLIECPVFPHTGRCGTSIQFQPF